MPTGRFQSSSAYSVLSEEHDCRSIPKHYKNTQQQRIKFCSCAAATRPAKSFFFCLFSGKNRQLGFKTLIVSFEGERRNPRWRFSTWWSSKIHGGLQETFISVPPAASSPPRTALHPSSPLVLRPLILPDWAKFTASLSPGLYPEQKEKEKRKSQYSLQSFSVSHHFPLPLTGLGSVQNHSENRKRYGGD